MTLEWEVEDNSSDDFPDLVCHSAYTRGGTRITVMGLGIEGARTYSILDYTDPYDGTHVSRLQLSSYQHDGWINENSDVVHDEDECDEAFEWEEYIDSKDIATITFDNLDAAKAQAEKWETMRIELIERSWRGDKWELVED